MNRCGFDRRVFTRFKRDEFRSELTLKQAPPTGFVPSVVLPLTESEHDRASLLMHKVHHFDWQSETDSNFPTVLSIWDRMAMTFRMRPDPKTIVFRLEEFTDSSWQTWFGMWKTPFIAVKRKNLVLYTTAVPCPMCQAAIF